MFKIMPANRKIKKKKKKRILTLYKFNLKKILSLLMFSFLFISLNNVKWGSPELLELLNYLF